MSDVVLQTAVAEQIESWLRERQEFFDKIIDELAAELLPLVVEDLKRRLIDELEKDRRPERTVGFSYEEIDRAMLLREAAELTEKRRSGRLSVVEFASQALTYLEKITSQKRD
jgi:hypothetical protein